jgi:hypothetical protein
MGQAKQRGSFEVRKAQSVERQKQEAHERWLAYKAAEAAETPEQKKKKKSAQSTLMLVAAAYSLGGGK